MSELFVSESFIHFETLRSSIIHSYEFLQYSYLYFLMHRRHRVGALQYDDGF